MAHRGPLCDLCPFVRWQTRRRVETHHTHGGEGEKGMEGVWGANEVVGS